MSLLPCLLPAAAILAFLLPGTATGAECADRYFAPEDEQGETALPRPHRELARTLEQARSGDGAAQRSLAVFYEAGYLVSRCGTKAEHWYRKAALAGDDQAKAWVRRHDSLERLGAGPECAGPHCFGGNAAEYRVATFFVGPGGHYFAPVTINGITVNGLIDTGASTLAMSEETARRLGIDYQSGTKGMASTANGNIASSSVVVPTVTVGGITLSNVRASVGITGDMLIGMSFLGRLNVRMEAGQLTLSR